MSKKYVTSPIYYVNGDPHIGHVYTTVLSDVWARYHRLIGDDVRFVTGTDEHGLKIQRAAEDRGIEPQQLADNVSATFRSLFDRMDMSYDRFIRTTEDEHRDKVQQMVRLMKESGDIYLGKYEGWYSASDEAYYSGDEVIDGIALPSGSEVEWVEEDSYFFRLSEYEDKLLDWCRGPLSNIQPKSRQNEVISFLESGLEDLSISRTTFNWGIPWPDDPDHVLYVWVDALTSYLTAAEDHWPADVHFIGKDILRFHAVYWPAFLMSTDHKLPDKICAHGWWVSEDGSKMSKSKGNVIDPVPLIEQYGNEPLRFYLLHDNRIGRDGRFSVDRLIDRWNSEVVNNIGNLVNRVFSMVDSYLDGQMPDRPSSMGNASDSRLFQSCEETAAQYQNLMDECRFNKALIRALNLSNKTNEYIQANEPWKLSGTNPERLGDVLWYSLEAIRLIGTMLVPFVPSASEIVEAFDSVVPEDAPFLEYGLADDGTELGELDGVPFDKVKDQ